MLSRGVLAEHNLLRRSWLFILSVGLVLLLFGLKLNAVHAENLNINTTQNCDGNSVVWCGASSVDQLINRYNNGDGHNSALSIHDIYNYFGITPTDISNMALSSTDVQSGTVTKSGDVIDSNGKIVATGAMTAGRDNIAGSTAVHYGVTSFFKRPPSVSFLSNSLQAYVVMVNGKFSYAILASCGNPVIATPVASPAPKPAPTPTPAPAPTPVVTQVVQQNNVDVCGQQAVNNSTVNSSSGNCNTTVVTPVTAQCGSIGIVVSPSNPYEVTATVNPIIQTGATLSSVTYNFGDNQVILPTTDLSMSHTYATGGTYLISATLAFSGAQSIPSSVCETSITIASAAPTCDALSVTPGDNRVVTVTNFQTTANGATLANSTIDWGDGTSATLPSLIGQTHQYASAGNYTVTATANYTVNGQSVPTSSQNCQAAVAISSPTTPTPVTTASTTPTPTLVNTGPGSTGSMLTIFGGSSILGSLGYRVFLRRRIL